MEGMKIVLDVANGATYKVAPVAFASSAPTWRSSIIRLNGLNINDGCGSQYTEDLRRTGDGDEAALGLAFDGDGDRLIAVDEKGHEMTGDQILMMCALMLKEQGQTGKQPPHEHDHEQPGFKNRLQKTWPQPLLQTWGIGTCSRTWSVSGGVIGGEDSGHMIFLDHHTTGDGIMTAMQVIASMVRTGKRLSEIGGDDGHLSRRS